MCALWRRYAIQLALFSDALQMRVRQGSCECGFSRIEQPGLPAVAGLGEYQALMQAEFPILPELEISRRDSPAGPVGRTRHVLSRKTRLHLGQFCLEQDRKSVV